MNSRISRRRKVYRLLLGGLLIISILIGALQAVRGESNRSSSNLISQHDYARDGFKVLDLGIGDAYPGTTPMMGMDMSSYQNMDIREQIIMPEESIGLRILARTLN